MRAVTCVLLLSSALAWAEKPRLVVLDLTPGGGADPAVVNGFTEAMATTISKAGYFDVQSSRDVQQLLGVERQRQLLGCSDGTCMTELAGAINARFVLSGSLVKLGDAWQLTLTTLDSQKSQPIGRATRIAKELPTLQAQLPWSTAEATATPLPEPPSKVLPLSLMAVGGAAIVVGAVLGLQGLFLEQEIKGELSGATLMMMSSYQSRAADAGTFKTASLITLIVGVAVVGCGIILYPRGPSGTQVSLLPTLSGAALAGSF
jgi:hypothetical protein